MRSLLSFRWWNPSPTPPPPPPPPSVPPSGDGTPPGSPIRCPPDLPTEWKYDLFVSYRGKDVKKKFRSHLFSALKERDIDYFLDNHPEGRGDKVADVIFGAIPLSKVAILLISPNYADSRWCLNELVEILKYKKEHKIHGRSTILPIFFGVAVEDVKARKGEFGEAFERLKEKNTEEKVKEWTDALMALKELGGISLDNDCHGDENLLIEKILDWLLIRDIPDRNSVLGRDVIGRDRDADSVISLYRSLNTRQRKNVSVIGVYGVQDVGKTCLAKLLISCVYSEFKYVGLLENVREETLEGLVEKLLGIVSERHRPLHYHLQGKITYISSKLRQTKALLVFDDVDRKDKLEDLLQDRQSFCSGTMILITTRDEQLLNELEVDDRYMVSALGTEGSLQLFCRHAFKEDKPRQGYEELSTNLCHYTGGLPRALEKLGSHFRCNKSSRQEWEKALEKLVRNPHINLIGSDPLKVGPFPNSMPSLFDDKAYTGVRQIKIITVDSTIESITIDYDQNGCLIRSARYGGTRQGSSYMIKLDYPREYLTSVSGFISENRNPEVIQSLMLYSNVNKYGPFGVGRGRKFSYPKVDYAKIIGFHGNSGASLHSIGAYFGPVSDRFPLKKVGPFGGQPGGKWDDGKYTDIRQVDVSILDGSVIESISVWYDDNGRPTGKVQHGRSARGELHSIKLDYPQEYLTSVYGYITKDQNGTRISSITMQSNRQAHGPFGKETGRKFSFPTKCGKIVGFYGRCQKQQLESIGAHYELVSHIYPFKVFGPFGGESGVPWDDRNHSTDIKSITITYGSVINSISCVYDNTDKANVYGGSGDHYKLISLDYPDEYLTSMCGYTKEDGRSVVNSITFQSNRRTWGPFGTEEGNYFSLPLNSGKIIGFYGRTDGCCLNAIGAHFEIYSSKQYPFKSVSLFGGEAENWDDKRFTKVRRLEIVVDSVVKSLKFEYETDEGSLRSRSHGSHVKGKIHTITLAKDEYLTSLSGTSNGDGGCIRSLTFQTNKRTCGPYGAMTGKYFSTPATGGKIVGFYGRNNPFGLTSIGAYYEPISLLYPARRIGPFGGQSGDYWCDENSNMVRQVKVLSDKAGIVRVYAHYEKNGRLFWSSERTLDESSQWKVDMVTLDYPNEYLTSISGYIMDYAHHNIVRSLVFQSNKRIYGPYGKKKPKGSYFWYPSTGGKIVIFYGYCTSSHLSSIGVYMEPISHLYPFKKIGPYGGQEGNPWDDGTFTDVRTIHIQYGSVIVAFSVEYDNNGSPVRCAEHGDDRSYMVRSRSGVAEEGVSRRARSLPKEEPKSVSIKLDYPKEYLISISGNTGKAYNEEVVRSLTVKTNLKTYSTYGTPKGKPFQLPEKENCGRIIGFHGTSGRFLNSLGARLEPF